MSRSWSFCQYPERKAGNHFGDGLLIEPESKKNNQTKNTVQVILCYLSDNVSLFGPGYHKVTIHSVVEKKEQVMVGVCYVRELILSHKAIMYDRKKYPTLLDAW